MEQEEEKKTQRKEKKTKRELGKARFSNKIKGNNEWKGISTKGGRNDEKF